MVDQISTNSPLSLSSLSGLIRGTSQIQAPQQTQTTAPPSQSGLNQFYNSPQYIANFGQVNPNNTPLQNFFGSPAYQLAYGNNNSADPSTRFQNDAGVQKAIQQGLKSLNAQYAAKGLGNSGANAQALSDYMYNQYDNWRNEQENMYNTYSTNMNNMYNNYTNQLNNLAQFGSTQTGGAQAQSNAQLLAQILSNANLSTGQQLGNANLSVGENIAQLLANQGTFGGNAYLNTQAAKANNIMQGLQLSTQIANVINQMIASKQGGMGSLLGLQGGGYSPAPAVNPYYLTPDMQIQYR